MPNLIIGLLIYLLPSRRRLIRYLRRHLARRKPITVQVSITPEPLPVGTPAAIATAMQPPVPPLVNNSQWMQWEHAERQHQLAANFAMMSTMRGNAALVATLN
ncbi:MAG TPA: hypothetical protein VKT22_07520 [Steroidobacteraceae bacterium]|nr:hypothetical protein [Steroidobacteraceae bacterium]